MKVAFRDQLYLFGIQQACHMPEVDDERAQVRGVSCRTLFVVDQNKLIKVNQVNFYSSFYQLNAEFIIQEKGDIMIDGNQTSNTDSTNRSQAQVTGQSNQATIMVRSDWGHSSTYRTNSLVCRKQNILLNFTEGRVVESFETCEPFILCHIFQREVSETFVVGHSVIISI